MSWELWKRNAEHLVINELFIYQRLIHESLQWTFHICTVHPSSFLHCFDPRKRDFLRYQMKLIEYALIWMSHSNACCLQGWKDQKLEHVPLRTKQAVLQILIVQWGRKMFLCVSWKTPVRRPRWFMWRARSRGSRKRKEAFQRSLPPLLPLPLPTCEVSLCYRTTRSDCQGVEGTFGINGKVWRAETFRWLNVKKLQDFSWKKWTVDKKTVRT